ncbi:ATP-binding protein, partial [Camelimonas abortus]
AHGALLLALPDPCLAVDSRGRVLAASPAAKALLPAVAAGRPLAFVLRAPEFRAALEAALAGEGPRVAQLSWRAPVERLFEATVTPFDAGDGRGALVSLRDLTASQRLEQMRADFIANASHELRTPLASLLGFIETLQGPARDDAAARERFLTVMREQALRMKRLIDDLLSLSRIETRAHQPPATRVDLAAVAAGIADAMEPVAARAGVTVVRDLPPGGAPVTGDRDELMRVVENLLQNALRYGASGGRVELAVTAGGDGEVTLTVRDFGPGVAPEHLPRLAERFYRVNEGDRSGSGLGLAIVRHIVLRHRGRLQFSSQPGEGLLARVTLPGRRSRDG